MRERKLHVHIPRPRGTGDDGAIRGEQPKTVAPVEPGEEPGRGPSVRQPREARDFTLEELKTLKAATGVAAFVKR